MAEVVYICCAVVSTICTILLMRSYLKNRARLLLWVAFSFGFLAFNNIFACFDLVFFPDVNMWGAIVRNALLAIAGVGLIAGLVWEIS